MVKFLKFALIAGIAGVAVYALNQKSKRLEMRDDEMREDWDSSYPDEDFSDWDDDIDFDDCDEGYRKEGGILRRLLDKIDGATYSLHEAIVNYQVRKGWIGGQDALDDAMEDFENLTFDDESSDYDPDYCNLDCDNCSEFSVCDKTDKCSDSSEESADESSDIYDDISDAIDSMED